MIDQCALSVSWIFSISSCWQSLETITRLRTNHPKTQAWGDAEQAVVDLQEVGYDAQFASEILGIGVGKLRVNLCQKKKNNLIS